MPDARLIGEIMRMLGEENSRPTAKGSGYDPSISPDAAMIGPDGKLLPGYSPSISPDAAMIGPDGKLLPGYSPSISPEAAMMEAAMREGAAEGPPSTVDELLMLIGESQGLTHMNPRDVAPAMRQRAYSGDAYDENNPTMEEARHMGMGGPKQRFANDPRGQRIDYNENTEAAYGKGPMQRFSNRPASAGPNQSYRPMELTEERLNAWNTGDDGSEVGFDNETLNILADMLDPEGVAALSASGATMPLLRGSATPEEEQYWNSLSDVEKLDLLDQIAASDGLGRILSFIPKNR